MADSEALKADGLNNTTDIISSIAVLIGLKLSQKPAGFRSSLWSLESRNGRFNGCLFHHDGCRNTSIIYGDHICF